jgi:carbonic anhydrase
MHTHTKEFQLTLTPQKAFEVLIEGNERFRNNIKMNRDLLQQMIDTSTGQYPFAVALSCMDSRTSVELIFDQGIGNIFSLRIAGNIINKDILGSMEYACQVVGAKVIVILGHTHCGAIKGACENVQLGNLTGLLDKIQPVVQQTAENNDRKDKNFPDKVAYANVIHTINDVLDKSPIIRALYNKGTIGILGAMYSVETGEVTFIKEMFNNAPVHQHQQMETV